jgi:protein CpxP
MRLIMKMTEFGKTSARVAMLALCTTALGVGTLMAQDSAAPPAPAQGEQTRPMGRPGPMQMQERQLERMTKELNLSPDQVTQIKTIQGDTNKQMMALRDDTSTAPEDKRPKMMSIRKGSMDKVRSVLTDDQKTKFDAMESRMRERREGGHEGSGTPPAAPPQ